MAGYSVFDGTIADMTWPQVEAAGQRRAIMLVPVAVIEQHGPHLPLATDTYAAYLLCQQTRVRLEALGVEAVIAPPYYFGMTPTTAMFPGSLSIDRDAMAAVLGEAMRNYAGWGFTRQFVINHHGDPEHNGAIMQAISIVRSNGIDAVLTLGGWVGQIVEQVYTSAFGAPLPLPESAILRAPESDETKLFRMRVARSSLNIHAEERETSMIMRWFPDTLNQETALENLPPVLPAIEEFNQACAQGTWRELSPRGYIGDPSVATKENGELYTLEAADIATAIARFLTGKESA